LHENCSHKCGGGGCIRFPNVALDTDLDARQRLHLGILNFVGPLSLNPYPLVSTADSIVGLVHHSYSQASGQVAIPKALNSNKDDNNTEITATQAFLMSFVFHRSESFHTRTLLDT
jgi:hypothetical protein